MNDTNKTTVPGRVLNFVYAAVSDVDPALAARAVALRNESAGAHAITAVRALSLVTPERTGLDEHGNTLLRENMLSIMRRCDAVWAIGPDRDAFDKEEYLAGCLTVPFEFVKCPDAGPKGLDADDIRCAVHWTGPSLNCEVTSVLARGEELVPIPSPTELVTRGGCFGTATERHVDLLNDYIAALQRYRDEVLGTSRMYQESVETGPFFRGKPNGRKNEGQTEKGA